MQKGAQALGVLKEYEGELEVLEALLGQKVWRRGRRGKWYERRAAILMTHLCEDEKSKVLTRAIEGVKEALMDDDTSLGESTFVNFSALLCKMVTNELQPTDRVSSGASFVWRRCWDSRLRQDVYAKWN